MKRRMRRMRMRMRRGAYKLHRGVETTDIRGKEVGIVRGEKGEKI
jgi:hypothetical protein